MGEGRFFRKIKQPQITDKEINEAGENELADITERESEWKKEQKEIFLKLKNDILNKEFNFDVINSIDDSDKQKIEKLLGINFNKVSEFCNLELASFFNLLEDKISNSNINLINESSFQEIFRVVSTNNLGYINTLVNNRNDEIYQKKLENPDSMQRKIARKIKFMIEYLVYYIKEIDEKSDKFKLELETNFGYVENFKKYLRSGFEINTGSNRLLLFYLFSKLNKKHLNFLENGFDDFLEETKKYNLISGGIEQYLEIDKIKEDFAVNK